MIDYPYALLFFVSHQMSFIAFYKNIYRKKMRTWA